MVTHALLEQGFGLKFNLRAMPVTILKYILINIGFCTLGFCLSYAMDLSSILGLSHSHDLGILNLFLMTTIFTIVGFSYTAYLFFENKVLFGISLIFILALVSLLYFLQM